MLSGMMPGRHVVCLQAFSLSVLLELVRGQQTGTFSQALFASTAEVLLSSKTVSDDAIEAFKGKFLQFADVRSANPASAEHIHGQMPSW